MTSGPTFAHINNLPATQPPTAFTAVLMFVYMVIIFGLAGAIMGLAGGMVFAFGALILEALGVFDRDRTWIDVVHTTATIAASGGLGFGGLAAALMAAFDVMDRRTERLQRRAFALFPTPAVQDLLANILATTVRDGLPKHMMLANVQAEAHWVWRAHGLEMVSFHLLAADPDGTNRRRSGLLFAHDLPKEHKVIPWADLSIKPREKAFLMTAARTMGPYTTRAPLHLGSAHGHLALLTWARGHGVRR